MRKHKLFLYLLSVTFLLTGCAGIKTLTIQTQEPARVTLPATAGKLLIVDNTATQPSDIGHSKKRLGRSRVEKVSVKTDSLSLIYTEALTQFLNEEGFYEDVMLYNKSMRDDNEYWREIPIAPEKMQELKKESDADAVVSLDKLLVATDWEDLFMQQGYPYSKLTGKISSTLRIYMPTQDGLIPTIQYIDSLYWEGFDIASDGMAYAEFVVPHAEPALKELAVYVADKMTYALTPHWITQERWYYTLSSSNMRKGENFAEQTKWAEAIDAWEKHYLSTKKAIDKAKAASNVALGYEMLDDIDKAYEWILKAETLFDDSTSKKSLERKRIAIYKAELERRLDTSNKLNMQIQ